MAAWHGGSPESITIHTATGGQPTEFVGRGGDVFAYDLECPGCAGSVRLDLDEAWRGRILAAADDVNGELNVSEHVKPGGVVTEVLEQAEAQREQLTQRENFEQRRIEVLDDVSEDEAVQAVQRQITDAGLESTEGEARRIVRDARASAPE
ncbi:MAG: hypothetical protein WA317_16000 [Mycobacterium sp.]|uniref:hypothetical protein n=1 Tax=Mycobacterium sp. TaxID=1785 RepID=UPI003CC6B79F